MNDAKKRFCATLTLSFLLLLNLACGASGSDGPVTEQNYSARTARFGTQCDPFVPAANATIPAGSEPCLELMLEGYYTEGTLEADLRHGEQQLARSTITFDGTRALLQRLTEGEAASRVTFAFHGQLPPSDGYRVVVHRNGREVAEYPFRVAR